MNNIQNIIDDAYNKNKNNNGGKVADYIPELAKADPKLFGISFVSCDGSIYEAGDAIKTVPIESISKVFSLALAVEHFGIDKVDKKIGNNGSSLPFNNVVACVLSDTHTINPFVNQGAMATTSLFYDTNKEKFRRKIIDNLDNYAGRKLALNKAVYNSEMTTNSTNLALAYLLQSYKRFYGEVIETLDVYTEQCSKNVSARDLATMACVFAKGGIHPHDGHRIISPKSAKYVYRALRGEGLYEYSGKWDTDVGAVSAKSGVGGGIFIIIKGIGGLGIVSPPLDKIGNSVRGISAGTAITIAIDNLFKNAIPFCSNKITNHRKKNNKTRKQLKSNSKSKTKSNSKSK